MAEQIRNWQLVDLHAFALVVGDARTRFFGKSRAVNRLTPYKADRLENFILVWSCVTKVAMVHVPTHLAELNEHQSQISSLASKFQWYQVAEYDLNLRFKKADKPDLISLYDHDAVVWLMATKVGINNNSFQSKGDQPFTASSSSNAPASQVCFAFNRASGCRFMDGSCKYSHHCSQCNGKHPAYECPSKKRLSGPAASSGGSGTNGGTSNAKGGLTKRAAVP